jgi:hypothetical protein
VQLPPCCNRGAPAIGEAICEWRDRFRESGWEQVWRGEGAAAVIRELAREQFPLARGWSRQGVAAVAAHCFEGVSARAPGAVVPSNRGWEACAVRALGSGARQADRATVANWDATSDKSAHGRPGSGKARETGTPAKYPAHSGGSKDVFPPTRSWRRNALSPPVYGQRWPEDGTSVHFERHLEHAP